MTPGPYLHLGGDESLGTDPDDFAEFMARATAIVADLGKTPVTWHEAGAAAGLHPDTIGQYWGFVTPTDGMDEKTRAFVAHGAQVILSPADAIYLDMKYDDTIAARAHLGERPDERRALLLVGALRYHRRHRRCRHPGRRGPAVDRDRSATCDDIDAMAFPRIAAAAEAAWSPADRLERPAHVGVVPHAGRRPRAALDEPRHPVPRFARDPVDDRVTTVIHSVRLVPTDGGGRIIDDAWVRFDGDGSPRPGRATAGGRRDGCRDRRRRQRHSPARAPC